MISWHWHELNVFGTRQHQYRAAGLTWGGAVLLAVPAHAENPREWDAVLFGPEDTCRSMRLVMDLGAARSEVERGIAEMWKDAE